ncbi:hypothetical protein C8035_v011017 [Colletotrichum spinosum]|uniref:Uncharacterized protein n=1 Tax=Colletotrichum spinosum TaxID=1347390 RepID=A0A4R8Q2W6_9PEZI|nr:hypothetical protein C8035_v011017 [Colletotrichum spinosum]
MSSPVNNHNAGSPSSSTVMAELERNIIVQLQARIAELETQHRQDLRALINAYEADITTLELAVQNLSAAAVAQEVQHLRDMREVDELQIAQLQDRVAALQHLEDMRDVDEMQILQLQARIDELEAGRDDEQQLADLKSENRVKSQILQLLYELHAQKAGEQGDGGADDVDAGQTTPFSPLSMTSLDEDVIRGIEGLDADKDSGYFDSDGGDELEDMA